MSQQLERLSAALSDRYRIERELGQGGMATVYLAEDLKHKRHVALKVLKPELAAVLGADRFIQEITTTAALQHPHILPLFDSGTADGFLYYVMPFIDGETLRSKLDRETQLGIDEAVKITVSIADALDYAHRRGVIHRDIKPENILLHEGRPMVADFGIALAVSAAAGGRMTETGLSLGTPHYMSPEQATAEKEISARSDIYSLASVLYEMLTGNPPHVGASAQQIIMKIVTEEAAPVTKLRKSVPHNVAAALAQALEKLPADRFESAKMFAEALANQHFTTQHDTSSAPGAAGAMRKPARTVVAALALILIAGTAGRLARPRQNDSAVVTHFTIPVPGGHDMTGGFMPNLAVSDDGRSLAYFVAGTLYHRRLDGDEPRPLARLDAGCCPEFSLDGQTLFVRYGEVLNQIWSVSVRDGTVANLGARPIAQDLLGTAWSQPGIHRRAAGDTIWTQLTARDSTRGAHMWPQRVDGGRSLLFTMVGDGGMWNGASIVLQDLRSGERTVVATEATYGRYVPTGHVVYVRADGSVEAIPVDVRKRRVTGSAFTVLTGVRTGYWAGAGEFAISPNGTLAYVRGSSWQQHRLAWVDRQGQVLGHVGEPVTLEGARLSPDERHVVSYVASPNADIDKFDIATGEQRRITFDPQTEDNPLWSPAGDRIAYRRHANPVSEIWTRTADGQGVPEQIAGVEGVPMSWSPDGTALALGRDRVLILHLDTRRVDTLPRGTASAAFSPDGKWLAYASSETGKLEIHVKPYPALTGNLQVSRNGGRLPLWSARSGELFFLNVDTLMATTVSTGHRFEYSTPRALFVRPDLAPQQYPFSVSGDGRRFLYPIRNPDASAREIHVILNWFQELKAKSRQ